MPSSNALASGQEAAFDRLLDVIAEEIVERYLAELEGSDEKQAREVLA